MPAIDIYLYLIVFILGLTIGSFLNVVAIRLLKEKDFIFDRSKCPKCEEKIAWYDNIPVLSFILLLGKCRHCKERISFQYPTVEIATALLFIAIYYYWGLSWKSVFLGFLTANLIVITLTDLKEKVIFDMNSIPIIPLGLIYNFFDIGNNSLESVKYLGISFNEVFISAVLGALLGAAFFEFFSRLGYVFSGEYAFGGGDTILGAALGAWFGWKAVVVILILSLLLQMVVGIPVIIHNLIKTKEYKSLTAMGGLLLSLVLSIIGRTLTYSGQFGLALTIIISAFIVGGISVFVIFSRLRETQNYTFLPFGPPLVLAGFIVMFAGDKLVSYLPF